MRAVLDYCTGGAERTVSAGTLVIHEGGKTGHLFVLIEGRLEVVKGDSVVACSPSPAPCSGNVVLLDQPHTRPCVPLPIQSSTSSTTPASFLRDQPAVALLIGAIAGAAAQCRRPPISLI